MKSMRSPSAVIFFMTYFDRAGRGAWPLGPLDPLHSKVLDVCLPPPISIFFIFMHTSRNRIIVWRTIWDWYPVGNPGSTAGYVSMVKVQSRVTISGTKYQGPVQLKL